jgi:hypothetical protein
MNQLCQGCSQRQCYCYQNGICSNQQDQRTNSHLIPQPSNSEPSKLISISFPYFLPIIDLQDIRTHIWMVQDEVSTIMISILSINDLQNHLDTLRSITCQKWLQISDQSINPEELLILDKKSTGLIVRGQPSYQDEPKQETWNKLGQYLTEIERLQSKLTIPIIPWITGIYPDQQQYELEWYQHFSISHVIVVGGMYALIKHHKHLNVILDRVWAQKLTPILYWDGWWIPSPLLHVTHVMSGSWWQYGVRGIDLTKCQRRGLPPVQPQQKNSIQLKKKANPNLSEFQLQLLLLKNYHYMREQVNKRITK